MDTSKDYYESVMRDFGLYGRGRSLEQYCRDEAVDYKWLDKAREKYGTPVKAKAVKPERKSRAKTPDMIQLHYDPETAGTGTVEAEEPAPLEVTTGREACQERVWRVLSLRVITPTGHEIEIRTSNTSAVSELLEKLEA